MSAALALIVALLATASQAPALDPLQAPACLAAQQQLKRQEDLAAADRTQRPALDAARRQVGVVCLGAPDAPPQVLRAPQAPQAGAPSARPAAQTAPRPSPAPPSPSRTTPPLSVTSCDAVGCWASDGTRLQRVGPLLLGPRGYCSAAGSALSCP